MTAKDERRLFQYRVEAIEGSEALAVVELQDRCKALESKLNEVIGVLSVVLQTVPEIAMTLGDLNQRWDADAYRMRPLAIDPLELDD